MAVAVTFTDRDVDAGNLTTYTITNVDFGATASDRKTAVGFRWRESGATERSVSSVTINGIAVPAGQLKQAHNVEGGAAACYVDNPSDTSGTVEITFSGGVSRLSWGCGRITGAADDLHDFAEVADGQFSAGDVSRSADVDVLEDGGVFGYCGGSTAGATLTLTWTGLTGDTTQSVENLFGLAGRLDATATETPRDIDANYDVPTTETIFGQYEVVLSFAPASEDGVLASAGVATAAFVGAADALGVLAANGVATVAFDASGRFDSAGVATVAFVGSLLLDGALVSAGVAGVAFDSGLLDGIFASAGVADADFEGVQQLEDGAFAMAGMGEALFVGEEALRWTPDAALVGDWTPEASLP